MQKVIVPLMGELELPVVPDAPDGYKAILLDGSTDVTFYMGCVGVVFVPDEWPVYNEVI